MNRDQPDEGIDALDKIVSAGEAMLTLFYLLTHPDGARIVREASEKIRESIGQVINEGDNEQR